MPSSDALVEMLAEAALRLNRHLDLEQLLHDVVDLSLDTIGADACFVYLYEEGDLVLRASSNAHPDELGRLRMRIGEGITGWVAQQRRPVALAEKASADARFKFYSNLPEDRFEAFLSVPILYRNQVQGVINLQHREVHPHTPGEIKSVQALGLMLGEALDRAEKVRANLASEQSLAAIADFAELLAHASVTGKTCEKLAGLLGAQAAFLWLIEEHIAGEQAPPVALGWSAAGEMPAADPEAYLRAARAPASANLAAGELLLALRFQDGFAGCLLLRFAPAARPDPRLAGILARLLANALELERNRARCAQQEEALAARKLVERAKGVLQREQQISEEEAYRLLKQESRRNRRSMAAVAQALLTSRDLRSEIAHGSPAGEPE